MEDLFNGLSMKIDTGIEGENGHSPTPMDSNVSSGINNRGGGDSQSESEDGLGDTECSVQSHIEMH